MSSRLPMLQLAPEIVAHLGDGDAAFDQMFALTGKTFRDVEGRETVRVEIGGEIYFVKRHRGLGWKNIFRTLLACRWPVVSARNEFDAVRCLNEVGIPTVDVVGFGERGHSPATRQSFLLMKELRGCIDLEKVCNGWLAQSPSPSFRRALITEVAATTRLMHEAGLNHRDYYLCHLWLEQSKSQNALRLFVIDLHRAMRHVTRHSSAEGTSTIPFWWRAKDLAGLLFSFWDCGLTKSDCLRFVCAYRGSAAREVFANERWLWRVVVWRAWRLFRKTHRRDPITPLRVPKVVRQKNTEISSSRTLSRAAQRGGDNGNHDIRRAA